MWVVKYGDDVVYLASSKNEAVKYKREMNKSYQTNEYYVEAYK